MSHIAVYRDGELVSRRELTRPMIVGRARESDIWVPDIRVSRRHCRIEPEGDGWAVLDLDSRNGILVRGEPVRRHVLGEGDEVQIGDAVLRFFTAQIVSRRPRSPDEALEAARSTMRGQTEHEESWREDLPVPKPQAKPAYPGSGAGADDMPTGSTMLGYGREGSGLLSEGFEGRGAKGPPPEMMGRAGRT
jgi:pSer/pThr/pTyr-binding forkhead associated (FHA) protein